LEALAYEGKKDSNKVLKGFLKKGIVIGLRTPLKKALTKRIDRIGLRTPLKQSLTKRMI